MTSAGTVPPAAPPSATAEEAELTVTGVVHASWTRRVLAAVLDQSLLVGAAWFFAGPDVGAPTLWPTLWDADVDAAQPWTSSFALVIVAVLLLGLQGDTGWTPGKLVVGIAVVRDGDLRPAGFLRTVARAVFHLVDALLMIGYLRPLWNAERRTFADSAMATVVVLRHPTRLNRGWHVALTAAAALVCALGVGFSIPSWSAGGVSRVGSAQCVPQVTDERVTAEPVVVEVDDRWDRERRLWMVRSAPDSRDVTFGWRWSQSSRAGSQALDVEDAVLTVSAARPDGTGTTETETRVGDVDGLLVQHTGSTARAEAVVSLETARRTSQPGPETVQARALGNEVRLTSALVLDGEVVATCTVDRLVLSAAPSGW
ncbi:RDD family protein [Xylanimonas oleitrophica]|uniref:RDD family protein n=1 Tax=Xylanimonas oleitrophica TaxID=2607479 RepID=UPI0015D01F3B|nr:RDD family protein [Xylanimonas oleitrophica]